MAESVHDGTRYFMMKGGLLCLRRWQPKAASNVYV